MFANLKSSKGGKKFLVFFNQVSEDTFLYSEYQAIKDAINLSQQFIFTNIHFSRLPL